jgi:hypothetical protein
MSRRHTQSKLGTAVVLVSLAAATLANSASAGSMHGAALPTKTVAEKRVIRALSRNWRPSLLREFVNARTRLPLDNVQANCRRPRGTKAPSSRFICVVRPGDPQSKVRLYLSYVSLPGGGSRIHWLDLRGR